MIRNDPGVRALLRMAGTSLVQSHRTSDQQRMKRLPRREEQYCTARRSTGIGFDTAPSSYVWYVGLATNERCQVCRAQCVSALEHEEVQCTSTYLEVFLVLPASVDQLCT